MTFIFNPSPTLVEEVSAAAVAVFTVWYMQPPKNHWVAVGALAALPTFFILRMILGEEAALLTEFNQGVEFLISSPILFLLAWGVMLVSCYLGVVLAMFFGDEVIGPIILLLGPRFEWILNPFSLTYMKILLPVTFFLSLLITTFFAYPIYALGDLFGLSGIFQSLNPTGIKAYEEPSYGGRGASNYGLNYLPRDIFQWQLAQFICLYDAIQIAMGKMGPQSVIPLLTFPFAAIINAAHRLGDIIYDFKFMTTNWKSSLDICTNDWFNLPAPFDPANTTAWPTLWALSCHL